MRRASAQLVEAVFFMRISLVIPTLNEEKTIGECIRRAKEALESLGFDYEIIVSDSSDDSTPEIARKLGAKVVFPDRRGYGYAYLYALRFAKGDIIVMGDGDGTYDFSEIPKLLEPLIIGEADFVLGSRFKGNIHKNAMPWLHRYIGNPILTWFTNFFFKTGVSDAHSGFRAIKRDAFERMKLSCTGMEFATEMVVKAKLSGLRISEVPINYYPRVAESNLRSFRDGWRHLRFMLLYSPAYLFLIPGAFFFLFGIFMMAVTIFGIRIFYNPGIHTMISSSLISILGYQLILFGIAGEVYRSKHGIRKSRITDFFLKNLSLELGVCLGMAIFLAGFAYSLQMISKWISSGFKELPFVYQDMIAFLLLVIGLQTFFFSFFLSMLSERNGSA